MSGPQPQVQVAAFAPTKALKYLGGFFAYGIVLSALYAGLGVGLPCPFRAITGWECPLCGGTRLGGALLHGDIAAAFAFNPLVLIGLVVLGVLALAWTVEALGGPRLRLPAQVAVPLKRVRPNGWLVVGLSIAVAFTVVRNLA